MPNECRRFPYFTAGFVCGCILLCILVAYIWYRPPLKQVPGWSASYTYQGSQHSDGVVFHSIFPGETYVLHLPHVPDERYQWFHFQFSHRIVCTWGAPYRGLFGYATPRHIPLGIMLTDNKIDDGWQVEWTSRFPRFHNPRLTVEITAKDGY